MVPIVMPIVRAIGERVRRARPKAAYRLAVNLGTVLRWLGVTRAIVHRNLQLACGRDLTRAELKQFERRYYLHMALLMVEFLRQPTVTRENLTRHFAPEGLERAKAAYDQSGKAIFVAGHVGVWELAAHVSGLIGVPLMSVAKLSGFEAIDEWVLGIREAGGQRIRGVKGSLWAMKKALDRGEAIGIVVDQEVRQGMTFVPFFGIKAATSSAPALLHRQTGAPIVVISALRKAPFRYTLEVLDVIRHEKTKDREQDVESITARINRALEDGLRQHPDQWLWSHRRWRRRPADEETPFARVNGAAPLRLEE